ncbi:S1 family peptidase [Micromonospora ureilytica]|uniref:S1 family peptidase n=1 Tax=Micromonospora ureilytica TaxID=709868 RepID=UPI00399056D1
MPNGRAALVECGSVWGAGFSISPTLLLTASYIVKKSGDVEEERPRVRLLGSGTFKDADVLWTSERLNVALLRTANADSDIDEVPCVVGRLIGSGPRQAESTGYIEDGGRYSDERVTAIRITGIVDPGTWPESRSIRFDATRPTSTRGPGMGGAGLCVDGKLVGILVAVNQHEGWYRATPVADALADGELQRLLQRELNSPPGIIDLLPAGHTVSGALEEVSKADPANIQEVAAAQFGLSNLYYENVLSQAKRSFNAAAVAAVVGLVFFLASVTFAIATQQFAASVTSLIGGGIVEVVAGLNFWLYGRTSVQLNAFHLRLERMQRFLLANSVSASLTGDRREECLAQLVGVISGGTAEELAEPDDG